MKSLNLFAFRQKTLGAEHGLDTPDRSLPPKTHQSLKPMTVFDSRGDSRPVLAGAQVIVFEDFAQCAEPCIGRQA